MAKAKKVVKTMNPVIKTVLLIIFILSLITSIIVFLYGLGLMIEYFIFINSVKKSIPDPVIFNIPLDQVKVRFALCLSFGFLGIVVFSVLLQKFFK